jgi:hypothetical protein
MDALRSLLRRATVPLLALGVVAGAAACGGQDASAHAAEQRKISVLETHAVPRTLLGLRVAPEKVDESLTRERRPWVDAVALYSLRKGKVLQATIQISRFSDDADVGDSNFRRNLVDQIGTTSARVFRMGRRTVWLTAGDRQTIAVWFRGRYFFVLATREDFAQPRTLLRQLLELAP